METVENILRGKRKKRKILLSSLEISQKPKKELVGPNANKVFVAKVDNEKFMEILEAQDRKMFRTHLVNQSDTHRSHDLFLEIGEKIQIKTNVSSIDYSEEETLLIKLYEMGFRQPPGEFKDGWDIHKLQS